NRVQATLVIPQGWSDSLSAGNPKPLTFYLDGSDINTASAAEGGVRSEEHTSELQSPCNLVCRLLLEKKKKQKNTSTHSPANTPTHLPQSTILPPCSIPPTHDLSLYTFQHYKYIHYLQHIPNITSRSQ